MADSTTKTIITLATIGGISYFFYQMSKQPQFPVNNPNLSFRDYGWMKDFLDKNEPKH